MTRALTALAALALVAGVACSDGAGAPVRQRGAVTTTTVESPLRQDGPGVHFPADFSG